MKCLLKYQWVKLPRACLPQGKGLLGCWARLAARAAFRKGRSALLWIYESCKAGGMVRRHCGSEKHPWHEKPWKSITDSRFTPEVGLYCLQSGSYYEKIRNTIRDWVLRCSGEGCMNGTVYATDGLWLSLPTQIYSRQVSKAGLYF